MRVTRPTGSDGVAISDEWRRWIVTAVGARATWTRQLDENQEWFVRPGDIPTFVVGLDAAIALRRAELQREVESRERLPDDPEARRHVLDAVLLARTTKDALYETTSALRRLFVEAVRVNETVMFDPFA
jgi:hypothetical protein